jgi:hypothetical protein
MWMLKKCWWSCDQKWTEKLQLTADICPNAQRYLTIKRKMDWKNDQQLKWLIMLNRRNELENAKKYKWPKMKRNEKKVSKWMGQLQCLIWQLKEKWIVKIIDMLNRRNELKQAKEKYNSSKMKRNGKKCIEWLIWQIKSSYCKNGWFKRLKWLILCRTKEIKWQNGQLQLTNEMNKWNRVEAA